MSKPICIGVLLLATACSDDGRTPADTDQVTTGTGSVSASDSAGGSGSSSPTGPESDTALTDGTTSQSTGVDTTSAGDSSTGPNGSSGSSGLDPLCDPAVSDEELARFVEAAEYSDGQAGDAVLVKKCGEIVFEHYAGQFDGTQAHLLASGTKSFTCTLAALAETDGLLLPDEVVGDTIDEWAEDPEKSTILVRHLLSLSSGLVDSPEYSATGAFMLDTYDLAINDSTSIGAPDLALIYAPSNFQVLAAMLERKSPGLDVLDYLYERLLADLGFDEENMTLWTRDIEGKPQMAGGARFTAREWSNFGQFMIQKGEWDGEQLLSEQLVERCTQYDNPTFRGYGFTWWLNLPTDGTYDPLVDTVPIDGRGDGDQIASNAPTDMFMAAGSGKQRLYVIPSRDLVIVRFGTLGGPNQWSDHEFLERLL